MTVRIDGKPLRSDCLGDIDACWTASEALDNSNKQEILQRKNSKEAIVASCYNPMLLAVTANSERDNVVDCATIETQDHVWVDFFDGMLVVTNDIVEASL